MSMDGSEEEENNNPFELDRLHIDILLGVFTRLSVGGRLKTAVVDHKFWSVAETRSPWITTTNLNVGAGRHLAMNINGTDYTWAHGLSALKFLFTVTTRLRVIKIANLPGGQVAHQNISRLLLDGFTGWPQGAFVEDLMVDGADTESALRYLQCVGGATPRVSFKRVVLNDNGELGRCRKFTDCLARLPLTAIELSFIDDAATDVTPTDLTNALENKPLDLLRIQSFPALGGDNVVRVVNSRTAASHTPLQLGFANCGVAANVVFEDAVKFLAGHVPTANPHCFSSAALSDLTHLHFSFDETQMLALCALSACHNLVQLHCEGEEWTISTSEIAEVVDGLLAMLKATQRNQVQLRINATKDNRNVALYLLHSAHLVTRVEVVPAAEGDGDTISWLCTLDEQASSYTVEVVLLYGT